MAIKSSSPLSFIAYIDQLINGQAIQHVLEKYHPKGQSKIGRKAYPALILFKMTLLQTWYNLSDYGIEEQLNDTLSFM